MRERLLEYNVRLTRRDRLPVRSVVVFLRETPHVSELPLVITWGRDEVMRYAFDVVRLWEIPQERVLVDRRRHALAAGELHGGALLLA